MQYRDQIVRFGWCLYFWSLDDLGGADAPTAYKPELIATSYRDGGEALEVAFGPGDDGVAETGVAPAASSALYFGALT